MILGGIGLISMFGSVARRPTRVCKSLRHLAVRLQSGSREEKWKLYQGAFPPRRGERILDLGVSALDDLPGENYFLGRYPYQDQLTAVGIDDLEGLRERYPSVTFITADGRQLPFADGSFDVVHSNAVIEHVGDLSDQRMFVSELLRVGNAGFVTTPYRWFPIETHCRLPLLHWLPRRLVLKLSTLLDQPDLRWRLLGAREFTNLFRPIVEPELKYTRILGWPLTLIVVYRRRVLDPPTP